ncbi:sugar kinase [Streptomyces sp. NPDC056411]|uniref:sugar kinase n=1 Tax=Streptomyces sp. NPDC056411 TaxID=3345813 RepID=UPI0035DFC739
MRGVTGRATAVQDGEGGGPGSGPEPSAAAAGDGSPRAGQAARPEVFTFGETMVALRGSGPLRLGGTMQVSVAGAESNVAIGLARLGHSVRWAGTVGDDEAGELVLRTLRAEGVEVSGTTVVPGAPTGLLLFEPRLPDVTRVHYYRAGSAGSRLTAGAVEGAFSAAPPRVLHLTGITPALSATARTAADRAVQLARRSGALVCLDVNFRSRLWTAEEAASVLCEWMPFVDILIASEDELPLCLPGGGGRSGGAQETPGFGGAQETPGARGMQETPGAGGASARAGGASAGAGGASAGAGGASARAGGASARAGGASAGAGGASAGPGAAGGDALVADQAGRLLDEGVREVVVKFGAAGATVHTGDGTLHQPAPSVRAVDAVGAGDAFVAGYLSALLDGAGPAGRLERATTTGAFAVASPGDWEGAPTRAELGMLGSPPGTVVR